MKVRTIKAFAFLAILCVCMVALGVCAAGESAHAASYKVNAFQKPASGLYFTGEEDVTYSVFINKEVYDAYSLQVRYQRVKLNSPVDTVTQRNGKAVEKYTVLDEEVCVEKDDMILTGNVDVNYAYFDVTTRVNCAWIFTFIYRAYAGDDEHSECSSDVLYCTRIDDAPPTITKGVTVFVADGYKITTYVRDKSTSAANSGVSRVELYKRTVPGETDELLETKDVAGTSDFTYVVTVPTGVVAYYVRALDRAGNDTGKVLLAQYTDQTYNADAEALAQFAITEFSRYDYAAFIVSAVNDAYAKYMTITRDDESTDAQKQAALKDLNAALTTYKTARADYEENGVKTTITVVDDAKTDSLSLTGTKEALAFLSIGDEAEITLTTASYSYSKKWKMEEEMKAAGLTKASKLYTINVSTVSKCEFSLRRELSAPYVVKLDLGKHEQVKAVQKTLSATGEASYHDCLVVEYADGTTAVEIPYSSGTVYLFATASDKDYVWLFYLLPVPLVPGIVLLVFGFVRMKKVKEKALAEQEAKKEEEKKETEAAKKPPKNKKKKK